MVDEDKMTRHPFQSSSFDRQASLYLNHQMNEKMHYDDRKYFDSKMTVKLIKVEPKGFGHVSYTAPPNPSQRSALPCQCYRGVLWSISAPAEKNEFAPQLFRMFYGEYKDMSFDSQLYAFGCNRVSESPIMFHKNHGGTKLLD